MAEDSEKSLISLRKAGKIYGTVTALKKIDLDIYKGQYDIITAVLLQIIYYKLFFYTNHCLF